MEDYRLVTLQELRLVIDLLEELLSRTTGDTDRLDLHQLLADLHQRMVHVQGRHLAAAAGLAEVWPGDNSPDVLLAARLLGDVVRDLRRLAVLEHDVDEHLANRAHAAALMLTA